MTVGKNNLEIRYWKGDKGNKKPASAIQLKRVFIFMPAMSFKACLKKLLIRQADQSVKFKYKFIRSFRPGLAPGRP